MHPDQWCFVRRLMHHIVSLVDICVYRRTADIRTSRRHQDFADGQKSLADYRSQRPRNVVMTGLKI